MPKTLMRGLELIEEIGRHGPLTVTELSRRTGVHITIVSRTVSACEPEGWLTRVDGKITTGPRCALLGLTSPVTATIREAEPLVATISGLAGLPATASALVGRDLMTLTSAGSEELAGIPDGLLSRAPIHVMAAGRAVAAQLPAEQLDAILPPEPYPSAAEVVDSLTASAPLPTYLAGFEPEPEAGEGALPRSRAELDAKLTLVRETGFARDHGELHPRIHCVASPWPGVGLPAALGYFGLREEIEEKAALIEVCLRAATKPGAGPREIVEAAAGH